MAVNVNDEGRPWTVSGGGPVLVIPAETAAAWRGTSPPIGAEVPAGWQWGASGGPVCDYDRACDPRDASSTGYGGFGWLEVDGKPALVLDAEITTVWVAEADGGTLVRSAIDESDLDPDAVAAEAWRPFPVAELDLTDGRLFMFDSAFAGDADPAAIEAHDGVGVIELAPGRWSVTCASNDDEVDFVRFRRAR